MHTALYTKYRPQTFADLVGQDHVAETIRAQAVAGRLSHAYLFCGPRGTGKTTCARLIAKAANCLDPRDGDPCNVCAACAAINDGSSFEVVEIDAASNTGVDNIRELRDEAVYAPADMRRRVYIIDEVHMLSTSAFNAFLKLLEEPPPHVMFVLATTESHKLPATILSRCQRFDFRRITPADIAQRLSQIAEKENIDLSPQAALILGRIADGALRNGILLLEQSNAFIRGPITADNVTGALGLAATGDLTELAENIGGGDVDAVVSRFRQLYDGGMEPDTLLGQLFVLFRDLMTVGAGAQTGLLGSGYSEDQLKPLLPRFSSQRLIDTQKSIAATLNVLARSAEQYIETELCLIAITVGGQPAAKAAAPAAPSPDISALHAKVAQLEQMVAALTAAPAKQVSSPAPDRPAQQPVAQAAQPQAAANDDPLPAVEKTHDFYQRLRDHLPPGYISHLRVCDISYADGRMRIGGDASRKLSLDLMRDAKVTERIAAAARDAWGRNVLVTVGQPGTAVKTAEHRDDPLQELVK